jgi:PKD repeat protein
MAKKPILFNLLCLILILLLASSVSAITSFTAEETEVLTLSVDTIDLDGDNIIYTFSEPFDESGMWLTDYESAGEYTITITASDGIETVTKYVQIIVQEKNREPYLIEDSLTFFEKEKISLGDYLSDPDNDVLKYSFSEPFDQDGVWTPGYEDAGRYVVEVDVSDGEFTISRWVEVIIEETNQAPIFIEFFNDETEIIVSEGETLEFYVKSLDMDDDELTTIWNFHDLGVAQGTSGELYFNYFSEGSYNFEVTVRDDEFEISKSWIIVVENTNRAPEFDPADYNFDVKEGQLIKLSPSTTDQDGDELTYAIEQPFDDDGLWQIDYESAGSYSVVLTASDGEFETAVPIYLEVDNVDLSPVITNDLEISNFAEGDSVEFSILVLDPDGDIVSVEAVDMPADATMDETNEGEYLFTWDIPYDTIVREQNFITNILNALRLEQTLLREKTIELEFEACSNELCTQELFQITVQNTNQAPEFTEFYDQYITENDLVQPYFLAIDPDGDIIKYYFSDPLDKQGQWQTNYEHEGEYNITITASDGYLSSSETITIYVEKLNREPSIWTDKTKHTILEGQTIELYIQASDDDQEDELILTLTNGPDDASLEEQIFTWTPSYDTVVSTEEIGFWGKFISGSEFLTKLFSSEETLQSVEITVSDGIAEIPLFIDILVKNVNQAPEIISATPSDAQYEINAGVELDFIINAIDYDNDELEYRWSFSGFDYETVTGTDQISRIFTSSGEKRVTVEVSDGLESIKHNWIIEVEGSSNYGRTDSNDGSSLSSSSSSSGSGTSQAPSYAVYTVEDWK